MSKKFGQTLKTSFKVWSNFEINVSIFFIKLWKVIEKFDQTLIEYSNFYQTLEWESDFC